MKSLIQKYLDKQPRNKRAGLLSKLNNLKPFALSSVGIDASLTQEQIARKYQPGLIRDGKLDRTQAQFIGAVPDAGRNAVVIPKELFNDPFQWQQWEGATINIHNMGRSFFHEVGNLSSQYLFGDFYALANPKSPHPDSGDALEKCVFGNPWAPPPR